MNFFSKRNAHNTQKTSAFNKRHDSSATQHQDKPTGKPLDQPDQVEGVVDKVLFHNEDNGYSVVQIESGKKKIILTGQIPSLGPGEQVLCSGQWKHNPKHGWQLQVTSLKHCAPQSTTQILRFLESGCIKGIGPSYAEKLIEYFGDQTLHVFDHAPEKLLEVQGIGNKRAQMIIESWKKHRLCHSLIADLSPYGISLSLAQKIIKVLGVDASEKIKQNPYLLAKKIRGVGFKKADEIAQKMGFQLHNPLRLAMGIEYLLEDKLSQGHCCYPKAQFLDDCANGLQSPIDLTEQVLESLIAEDTIFCQTLQKPLVVEPYVWLSHIKKCEEITALRLMQLRFSARTSKSPKNATTLMETLQQKKKISLAPKQSEAILSCIREKVSIITGGPGTGKSTITSLLVEIFQANQAKVVLCAPTGRAAKRLSEINNIPAKTIHQLLEYNFHSRQFKRNIDARLELDLIIVDEASMIDILLLRSLLCALPDNCHCVLVGDTDQLPSVGPGQTLLDILESKQIPSTRLDHIYRQGTHSQIPTAAHQILKGIAPVQRSSADSDYFFIPCQSPERIVSQIESLVGGRLSHKYGFDPLRDIQVLSPMKKGPVGIEALNLSLQKLLITNTRHISIGYRQFYVGDKLIQTRNNYDKEVSNGDILFLTRLNTSDQEIITTTLEGKEVVYDYSEMEELQHAYAVSVHKYQGSETPCVIMPIHSRHTIMLHKKLLYTALTRGKKLVIFIGSAETFQNAVARDFHLHRYSALREALLLARANKAQAPF